MVPVSIYSENTETRKKKTAASSHNKQDMGNARKLYNSSLPKRARQVNGKISGNHLKLEDASGSHRSSSESCRSYQKRGHYCDIGSRVQFKADVLKIFATNGCPSPNVSLPMRSASSHKGSAS